MALQKQLDMAYTQENRLISINTPLGADALLLQGFSGHEGISRLFSFHLDVLSENHSIVFADLLGKNVTLTVRLADETSRYFNGIVSRFAQSGADARFMHCQMEVVPWLWLLTRRADCRIFPKMTAPDIIKKVFDEGGFKDYEISLQGTFDELDYCVQYRETDFNFVSRLMEKYGIFYFFKHEKEKHILVLGNHASNHEPCPGQATAGYDLVTGGLDAEDIITSWNVEQELRSGKYSLNDYNFETPNADLIASVSTVVNPRGDFSYELYDDPGKYLTREGGKPSYELYDYPGEYLTREEGSAFATIRMQEEEAGHWIINGSSECRAFSSGYKFDLRDYYLKEMNTAYILTEIHHIASVGGSYSHQGDGTGPSYSNHFNCILATVQFRPARITPKPFVQGPQTALVVGKAGEEIWVDKYGRVKVQFYWDRIGQKNGDNSCWIRVSQPWAGKNWGAISIPRVGQEVIVSFLEGDPDRPIITGRVYNADQTVPYPLPDHQTRSTFMTRSSKRGGSSNYNEIRFEDKKGSEQVFINAEKDMDHRVEKDSREYVGKDRSLIVKGKQAEKVEGDLNTQIAGNSNGKVGQNLSLQVGQSLYEKSGQNFAHEAGAAIHLKAGTTVVIEAGVELTLKAGGNFIDIGPSGIAISGTLVMINSGGAAGSGIGSNPTNPTNPDEADDGSKGDKLN